MKSKCNKQIAVIFIISTILLSLLNIIVTDKEFSELENRYLQKKPSLTYKKLLSGEFSEDFEKYITDQFPLRNWWIKIKSDVERAVLKKDNNGIYFGKDGYLFEMYNKPEKTFYKNIEYINSFIDKTNINVSIMAVPNSFQIYSEKLPLFANPYDQAKVLNDLKNNLVSEAGFIDLIGVLQDKKDEYIYFKTDHHWTMLGAYYGYLEYCKVNNIEAVSLEEFQIIEKSNEFYGTYYSKANGTRVKPDKLEILELIKSKYSYLVNYIYEDEQSDNFYDDEYLSKKDKYSYFFGGNHSLITIKTTNKNGKKLLVIKDSYANAMIPLLANNFEEIHVVDLRYYKYNIYDYIKENNINEGLVLYNISNFNNDTGLAILNYY